MSDPDASPSRSRQKRRGKQPRRLWGCYLVAVLLVMPILWYLWQSRPPSDSAQKIAFSIPPGTGAAKIADTLEQKGLVRSAFLFLWTARMEGAASKFKPGDYRLSPAMTPQEIITRLKQGGGDADDRSITIPEGFTVAQIADRLVAKGVLPDKEAFLKVARSKTPPVTAPFSLPENGLEGYLYPDTYRFAPKTSPERIAQEMLDRFVSAFYDNQKADILASGHSLHEIVTIASLIEREAEVPQDRARIAGVIENRLRHNMKLDIDATVLYALGHHKERLYYKDLRVDSPYNTYRHKGLPPGPIASPGIASLRAALAPEKHEYLFYVASPDGSHVFTRTEAEHNAAVARMRALRTK